MKQQYEDIGWLFFERLFLTQQSHPPCVHDASVRES